MANFLFFYYENKWEQRVKKISLNRAKQLTNVFRFIDDFTATNYCEFERNYKDIYPIELEFKNENLGNNKVLFLEFCISIEDNKLLTNT